MPTAWHTDCWAADLWRRRKITSDLSLADSICTAAAAAKQLSNKQFDNFYWLPSRFEFSFVESWFLCWSPTRKPPGWLVCLCTTLHQSHLSIFYANGCLFSLTGRHVMPGFCMLDVWGLAEITDEWIHGKLQQICMKVHDWQTKMHVAIRFLLLPEQSCSGFKFFSFFMSVSHRSCLIIGVSQLVPRAEALYWLHAHILHAPFLSPPQRWPFRTLTWHVDKLLDGLFKQVGKFCLKVFQNMYVNVRNVCGPEHYCLLFSTRFVSLLIVWQDNQGFTCATCFRCQILIYTVRKCNHFKRVQETILAASKEGRKCGKIWLSGSINAKCALSLIPTVVASTAKKIWTVSS